MKRLITIALMLCTASAAHAFCGFYVAGSNEPMFNDATQVVLMRKGTRTVLAMQNNYKGPLQDFAMVVPVPVVLHEGDVKTLPKEVFADVERMSAPRLVEYWERDPCERDRDRGDEGRAMSVQKAADAAPAAGGRGGGVVVEARFTVGEYQIEILSAKDSTGLDEWLHDHEYKVPAGAEPLLRPYVEGGSKWFVAKVDPKKVQIVDGRAALSPLRFHYDSEEFTLPIRLGLANSSGKQDLIVNILAPDQRYEVANYKNVTIPTNLDVTDAVKSKFGAFYAALYDRTIEKNPGAVVTEYAWSAGSCDPCPGPTLQPQELATLGLDVLDSFTPDEQRARAAADAAAKKIQDAYQQQPQVSQDEIRKMYDEQRDLERAAPRRSSPYGLVLTRLHARYGKDITNDLVFKQAPPIVGGREHVIDRETGKLEQGAQPASSNNFQGRYAIRHAWTGPIACLDPVRGRWGGPPAGVQSEGTQPALGLAFVPRDQVKLADVVVTGVPELDVQAVKRGCGCQASDPAGLIAGLLLGSFAFFRPRRRRARQ